MPRGMGTLYFVRLIMLVLAILKQGSTQWLGGQGAMAPPADFFEGAPKFKRGAKNFMKSDGSIVFFPAPRSRSHGHSIQMHLMQMHQSLSQTNHFESMLSFAKLTQTVIPLATAFM